MGKLWLQPMAVDVHKHNQNQAYPKSKHSFRSVENKLNVVTLQF